MMIGDDDCTNPAMQLKKWYEGMILHYRKECAKLPEEKHKQTLMNYYYDPPCQVEVFWLAGLNWQIAITTHFGDRDDLEIIVNGPYASNTFLDEAEKILKQPRWDRPIPKNSGSSDSNRSLRHGDHVAQYLHDFAKTAANAMFVGYNPVGTYFKLINSETESVEFFHGDRRTVDYEKMVKGEIAGITGQHKPGKKPPSIPKKPEGLPKSAKGFGAYFLPPIIIGMMPELTTGDRLRGTMSWNIPVSMQDRKSFVQQFGETLVTMAIDGHVCACTSDRELAIKILNTIMATFEINEFEARAVRVHDLTEIKYTTETLDITNIGYNPNKIRHTSPLDYPSGTEHERAIRYVQEDTVKKTLEKASKAFEDPDMANTMVNFAYMCTHLKNDEFSSAFIAGWKIIEPHITRKWKDGLDSKPVNTKKNPKRHPRVDKMLRAIKHSIPSQDYDTFMHLKGIRNEHIHEGGQTTKQQANDMLDAVKNCVLRQKTGSC